MTIDDHTDLSDSLSTLISDLTANCSMKGQAHDELHKWLLPFIDMNKGLKASSTLESAAETLEKLKIELTIFNTYFE